MSRSYDRHPDLVCPRGRRHCLLCTHVEHLDAKERERLHDFNDQLAELIASGRIAK